jgi:hypothetical protein
VAVGTAFVIGLAQELAGLDGSHAGHELPGRRIHDYFHFVECVSESRYG